MSERPSSIVQSVPWKLTFVASVFLHVKKKKNRKEGKCVSVCV